MVVSILGALSQSPNITITGSPDIGGTVTLSIPLANLTGTTATSTTLQLVGGASATYGTIVGGTTVSRDLAFTIPSNAECGSLITLTLNVDSGLGPVTFARTFAVGNPETTFSQNFDDVTPPALPADWTVTSSYGPMTFASTAVNPDAGPNSMFAADLPNCTTGCPLTDGGSTELVSPATHITATAATVTFRHKYNTEGGWDGGILEIGYGDGTFQEIIAAGGSFIQNGYNGQMGVSTPNPLGGQPGWTGDSGGYITTVVRLPASAVGQNVQFRWRFGADSNNAPVGGGWNVDTIQIAGNYICFQVSNFEVSGRVTSEDGRGLRNTIVTLTGPNGFVRQTTTSSFGFYQFPDIPPSQTYTVSVASRLFRFTPQTFQVNGNMQNVDFIGQQ